MADNLSYAFDPSQGQTPETVARRRQTADLLAARMFSHTPQNVGEGLGLIGQALIARQMQNEAGDAQKAGMATAINPTQLAAWSAGAPMDLSSPAAPSNISSATVPNDDNAIPGTVGMNQTLADRTQDFIQDNPGTTMTSGVRTPQQQAALYADRANNPNPVAPPGTSLHERGMAADIGGMTADQRAQLPQYGLSQPVANDPVHVQLAGNSGGMPASTSGTSNYGGPFPGASTPDLIRQSINPWNPAGFRSQATEEIARRTKLDQQNADPMRAIDMRYKQSLIDKATHDASNTEYGLNPVYGKDPTTGENVLGVIGKDGTFKKLDTGGVKVSTGIDKVDLGTHFAIYDKKSGQFLGNQPKDLQGAAAQTALGKAQGGMQATLPSDLHNADTTVTQIDQLIKHPGLSSIVGPMDQFRPSWTLGSEGRDALARFNQLKGKAFLQAYSTLRGGGAITEVEGEKAQNAIARMDRAQGEEEFIGALQDFRDAVQTGAQKLREKAGVGQAPAMATAAPQPDPLGLR